MKSYKFYSDAGHGWLAVKRQELIDFGIIAKVSAFSYERGATVYLEEDRDAELFISEYRVKHKVLHLPFTEHICNKILSPIRGYEHFALRIGEE